jgi:hypothetical protein
VFGSLKAEWLSLHPANEKDGNGSSSYQVIIIHLQIVKASYLADKFLKNVGEKVWWFGSEFLSLHSLSEGG